MSARTVQQRTQQALPSAREIYAVRFQQVDQYSDEHGRERSTVRTLAWPKGFTVQDVLARVIQSGLRDAAGTPVQLPAAGRRAWRRHPDQHDVRTKA